MRLSASLILGVAALVSTASCSERGCVPEHRLDALLEGGAPVCLGSSWGELKSNARGGVEDELGWLKLTEGSLQYTYLPGGGVDLGVTRVLATVRKGCASAPADAANPGALAHRIMRRLGGRWKSAESPAGVRNWRSDKGVVVGFRFYPDLGLADTCVGSDER